MRTRIGYQKSRNNSSKKKGFRDTDDDFLPPDQIKEENNIDEYGSNNNKKRILSSKVVSKLINPRIPPKSKDHGSMSNEEKLKGYSKDENDDNSYESFGAHTSLTESYNTIPGMSNSLSLNVRNKNDFLAVPSTDGIETPVMNKRAQMQNVPSLREPEDELNFTPQLPIHDFNIPTLPESPPRVTTLPTTPPKENSPTKKTKSKVSRIAKLFSVKAPVQKKTTIQSTRSPMRDNHLKSKPVSQVPSSPASSVSSAYLQWPGTQDKKGKTSAIYLDDDSVILEDQEKQSRDQNFKQDSNIQDLEKRTINNKKMNPTDTALAEIVQEAPVQLSEHGIESSKPSSNVLSSSPEIKSLNIHNLFGGSSTTSKKLHGNSSYEKKVDSWDVDSSIPGASPKQENMRLSKSLDNIDPSKIHLHQTNNYQQTKNYPFKDNSEHKIDTDIVQDSLQHYQPLSAAALAAKDKLNPLPRHINGARIPGYRGFIDKRCELPNLMDDESSIAESSFYENRYFQTQSNEQISDQVQYYDSESDVFDGLSSHAPSTTPSANHQIDRFTSSQQEYTKYGVKKAPIYHSDRKSNLVSPMHENIHSFEDEGYYFSDDNSSASERSEPYFDLSQYLIDPDSIKKLVKKFRRFCRESPKQDRVYADDLKKAFALFEMRSRVMETDIERSLQRRGGTVVVDDIVLTSYRMSLMRIRDIVIVSKAWRDGASPRDVFTAALLTRRDTHAYFVKRYTRNTPRNISADTQGKKHRRSKSFDSTFSFGSGSGSSKFSRGYYYLEERRWMDDLDFALMVCPSLGPQNMRGFDMFTMGDCHSLLLKLSSERCSQIRAELDEATASQIEAEDIMNDEMANDVMSEAEISYLEAMARVKALSRQLVVTEKAFFHVKTRIESLISKYQRLLTTMQYDEDDDSHSENSINSYSASDEESESEYDSERDHLARRARRAELIAEVTTRQSILVKQEAERIAAQKEQELEELQRKLAELETKSSMEREELQRMLDVERQLSHVSNSLHDAKSSIIEDQSKLEAKERVKAMFRERSKSTSKKLSSASKSNNREEINEQEMFQHVEFYERSLKNL